MKRTTKKIHLIKYQTFNNLSKMNTVKNQLVNIYILISIVIEVKDEHKENIMQISKNIMTQKLKMSEIIHNLEEKKEFKFTMETIDKLLPKTLSNHITNFFECLRENQELLFKLHSKTKSLKNKKNITSFVSTFFFGNSFSSASLEDDLLLLLYRTLEFEIQSLPSSSNYEAFLNESINYFFFKHFIQKEDIVSFFRKILTEIIESIDSEEDTKKLLFNPTDVQKVVEDNQKLFPEFMRFARLEQDKPQTQTTTPQAPSKDDNKQKQIQTKKTEKDIKHEIVLSKEEFYTQYIPSFTKGESDMLIQANKVSKEYHEYLNKQFEDGKDDSMYSHEPFIDLIYNCNHSSHILTLIYHSFITATNAIKKLFTSLHKNISVIPVSIRYICKFISMLVKRKFPNIVKYEENAFISEFFLKNLLLPIFSHSEICGLLKNNILLKNTKHNIEVISNLLLQAVSGKFYTNSDENNKCFILFNRFFAEIMPTIFDFIKELTNIKLPSLFDKIFNKQIDLETLQYNYFKNNPFEDIRDASVCICGEDLLSLIENITEHKESFFNAQMSKSLGSIAYTNFKEHFEFLEQHQDEIESFAKIDMNTKVKQYAYIQRIEYSPRAKIIMDFNKNNYCLKSVDDIKNEKQSLILKAKKALYDILNSLHDIPPHNFFGIKINNTVDFVASLSKLCKLNYFNLDTAVETDWYISSFRAMLKNFPDEYKSNDYAKFYEEMKFDLNEAIQKINYISLSQIGNKYRYAEKNLDDYTKSAVHLQDVALNNLVQRFLSEVKIPASLVFDIKNKQAIFRIKAVDELVNLKFKYLDDFLFEKKKDTGIPVSTVWQMTQNFPKFQKFKDEQFEQEKKFLVKEALVTYYDLILDKLHKAEKSESNSNNNEPTKKDKTDEAVTEVDEDEQKKQEQAKKEREILINRAHQIIKNYIMNKIFKNLFPEKPLPSDEKIFSNCRKLSWIESKDLFKKDAYNIDNTLTVGIALFKQFELEKSPYEKLLVLEKINELIVKTNTLIKGKAEILEMDARLNYLTLFCIKAQPERLHSNLKYIEIFRDDNESRLGGSIDTLKALYDFLEKDAFEIAKLLLKDSSKQTQTADGATPQGGENELDVMIKKKIEEREKEIEMETENEQEKGE